MTEGLDVGKIKKDFPVLQNPNLIYLDNSATSQKPYDVIRAVTDFYEKCNANPLRGLYELAQSTQIYPCKEYGRNHFYKECNREFKSCCLQLWNHGSETVR